MLLSLRRPHHLKCLDTLRIFLKTIPYTPLWPSGNENNSTVCLSIYNWIMQSLSMTSQWDTPVGLKTKHSLNTLAKVSVHVTILYRHSTEKNDVIESTEENPEVVKEHVFVISDDVIQDNNSVHKVQELLNTYLTKDLGQQITGKKLYLDGIVVSK